MIDQFAFLLFVMIAGHALCDLTLQPAWLSNAKRVDADFSLPWPAALVGHSLIHGGAVALATGLWWLGAAETVAHAAVDFAKSRGAIGMKTDQALHLLCKLAWAAIAVAAFE